MVEVAAALQRARSLDQHAFTAVFSDAEVAALVAKMDRPTVGPLNGMPFVVKDNIDVRGVPTTGACPAITAPAMRSAPAVERLMAAGAVPVAKANMDQFATGLVGTRSPFGACHSVASSAHISGGSSSGSAVAVAAGVVELALGTDTAGSGRVPAAFNGLVGLKPSRGLISNRGLMAASPSLDCISIFSRTAALARVAFTALVGFDALDPYSRVMPPAPVELARDAPVIGLPIATLDLDPEYQDAWEQAAAHLKEVAVTVAVDVEALLAAAKLLYTPALVAERLVAFGHLLEPDGPHLDPVVRQIVLGARNASAAEVFSAQHRLAALSAIARQAMLGIDAVLLPVTPGHPTLAQVAADPIGTNARLGTYTNMANLLDLCAIAVPAGSTAAGLPFGVQFLAPAFADHTLLDLASLWCGEEPPA